MRIRTKRVITGVSLIGVLIAGTFSNSASAATATLNAKEKAAVAVYAKALSKARSDYFVSVKPSQATVVAIGKPAETKRRTAVIAALIHYMIVVHSAKAPVLAAELAYRNAASMSASSPTNLSLKNEAKSKLDALNKASAALKVDRNIATARVSFSKARMVAMSKFKATLSTAVIKRNAAQKSAFAKFKIDKSNALAKFKVALKAAHSK
jgi:hypothetical protein